MGSINYSYYKDKDKFAYFGLKEIDSQISNMLSDCDFSQLTGKVSEDILYYTNPLRGNLLNWYEFDKDSSVLEINACLGSLTSVLCDKVKKVIAVESSKTCAEIINNKLKAKENLEIIVGDICDIPFDEKFDYIILTDILEMAPAFIKTENPHVDFLKMIKGLLKPDGMFILTISNKFGLKNWTGSVDEYSGIEFEKLLSYPHLKNVTSFSKSELIKIYKYAGFDSLEFYYPVPTHYVPADILSEEDVSEDKIDIKLSNYFQNYYLLYKRRFNERILMRDIIKNHKFKLFANSFLIFAKNNVNNSKGEFCE